MVAKLVGVVILVGVGATLTVLAQQASIQAPALQTGKSPSCNCAVFPWTPEPPCYKQCTTRIISDWPTAKLGTSLKLTPSVKGQVDAMKKGTVTPDVIDKFLSSDDGKSFLKSVAEAPKKELEGLASAKALTSSSDR